MSELFAELPLRTAAVRNATYARRAMVIVFAVVLAAGLLNAFGQRTARTTMVAPRASLTVSAPRRVRGGLFFQTRVQVDAHAAIEHPQLIFDSGVLEGMQVSSIEPAAASEASRDGRLALSYDAVPAGDTLRVWLQFQVDPTGAGRHVYGIELDDGDTRIARSERDLLVLP